MSKAPKDLRIPIMMSAADVEAIDGWRFANRIATRAEAVRRLCQIGLFIDSGPNSFFKEMTRKPKNSDQKDEMFDDFNALTARLGFAMMFLRRGKMAANGDIVSFEEMQKIIDQIANPDDASKLADAMKGAGN